MLHTSKKIKGKLLEMPSDLLVKSLVRTTCIPCVLES